MALTRVPAWLLILLIITAAGSVLAQQQQQQPTTPAQIYQPYQPREAPRDPSALTTEQLLREVANLAALMETRILALEKSQEAFEEGITRVPTEVQKAIAQLDAVISERFRTVDAQFNNVAQQFTALEVKATQNDENRANNIEAALTAQKELVATAAAGTAEQLRQIGQVQVAKVDSLAGQISDLKDSMAGQISDMKDRLTAIEQRAEGRGEAQTSSKDNQALWAGIIFGLIGAAVGTLSLVFAIVRGGGKPPDKAVERVTHA